MPQISFIIPIYNVASYLSKCLDSVLAQTLSDIEVICINDGSKDNSEKILQNYAAKDKRIKVINQRNQGISAARNAGLKMVQSDYVMFVDSDDYIAPDMAEKLYKIMIAEKPDVVICSAECVNLLPADTSAEVVEWQAWLQPWFDEYAKPTGVYDVPKTIKNEFISVVWNKLYKTSTIKEYKIKFPSELIEEDEYWLWAYMLHCRKYAFVNERLYFYIQRSGSIMTTRNSREHVLDILEVERRIYELVQKYADISDYREILADWYIKTINEILEYRKPQDMHALWRKFEGYMQNCNSSDKLQEFYNRIHQSPISK
ncbi:MAG: glycosyltransferase [Alphaproteobacteria bacterium]|nr:glycosyltransferase [Alphaproteobacteria bacterium]